MRCLSGALMFLGLVLAAPAVAQVAPPTTAPPATTDMPRLLLPVPAEEDWSFLADPARRTDPLDLLKYIPLGSAGAYLSIGGEARLYYEAYDNEDFGAYPGISGYLKQRYSLHADLHPTSNWRAFVQLQSAEIGARPGGPRPTLDRDGLDLVEGFVEWHSSAVDPTLGGAALTVRAGRQQLDLGAGRLVSAREGPLGEGPNALQGFDAVRGIWRTGGWRLDLFAARPIKNRTGVFDDREAHGQGLWGAYLTHGGPPGAPVAGIDLYYIGVARPQAITYSGIGDERRHIVGARAHRSDTAFDYDTEGFYQFGTSGARAISAWSISGQLGYTFGAVPLTPRVGAGAALNSGGGDAGTVRDVYAPFPRGAYFGYLSAIGPANLRALEASLTLHPVSRVTLGAEFYGYWRADLGDGLYDLAGYPLVAPTNRARYIGYQPALSASWQIGSHVTLNAAYETLARGAFLEQADARPIRYTAVWTTLRF